MNALLLAALSLSPTAAADEPAATDGTHLWVRQAAAVAGWPSGALSDTRAQVRTPLHRSDSVLFQDTAAGIGGRVAASPAFVEAGAHATLAPIAIFDVDLFAGGITYWPGGFGPLPTDHRGDTLDADRELRAGENVAARGAVLSAAPTLKAKVGPVIVFDAWTLRHQRLTAPGGSPEPWLYEPFTDLVVAWNDTIVEHQPGVLLDIFPDEGGAWLRVGGTMRDRWSLETGDRTLQAGALIAGKPGRSEAVPTIAGMALAYGIDDDRTGRVPFLGLQAAWSWTRSMGRRGPTPVPGLAQADDDGGAS